MTLPRISAIAAFILMASAFCLSIAWKPSVHLANQRAKVNLETLFPKSFGDWVVDERMPVQLISPDTQALLNKIYNETLSRTYVNRQGDRIMLSVAYGGDQSDGTRAHRPEVCYPAQGFQIMSSQQSQLTTATHPLKVRQLVAKLGGRNEPITYWVVVGDRIALSGTEQKLAQLQYSVRGIIPDGMLVRVSTIDADAGQAYAVQQSFVAAMTSAIPDGLRQRVIGSTGG